MSYWGVPRLFSKGARPVSSVGADEIGGTVTIKPPEIYFRRHILGDPPPGNERHGRLMQLVTGVTLCIGADPSDKALRASLTDSIDTSCPLSCPPGFEPDPDGTVCNCSKHTCSFWKICTQGEIFEWDPATKLCQCVSLNSTGIPRQRCIVASPILDHSAYGKRDVPDLCPHTRVCTFGEIWGWDNSTQSCACMSTNTPGIPAKKRDALRSPDFHAFVGGERDLAVIVRSCTLACPASMESDPTKGACNCEKSICASLPQNTSCPAGETFAWNDAATGCSCLSATSGSPPDICDMLCPAGTENDPTKSDCNCDKPVCPTAHEACPVGELFGWDEDSGTCDCFSTVAGIPA